MLWVWIWLGVVVASLIIEFITFELVTVWFALGGLVALIMAACDVIPLVHIITFSVVSLGTLLGLRTVCMRYLNKHKADTNTDLIIGKSFKLLSEITPITRGTIKVNDVVWEVKADDDDVTIPVGSWVIAQEISGNKIIVKLDESKVKPAKTETQPTTESVEPKKTVKKSTPKTTSATKKTTSTTTKKTVSNTAKKTTTTKTASTAKKTNTTKTTKTNKGE